MSSAPDPTPASKPYRGRFAPSPTGELHMGSLVTAIASALEARVRNGDWLVRIEDLDPPREVPGSAHTILATLEALGFEWHEPVLFQSTRHAAYADAVRRLRDAGHAFACACSRTDVAERAKALGPEGPVYPGTCRNGLPPGQAGRAIRLRAPEQEICFDDRLQGKVCQNVGGEIGDFVIQRADGHFAYQLAVVVDDAWQDITDVVRGADLLLSTPRQRWLQQLLGLPTPGYLHVPLLLDADGRKLSKQARSLPVNPRQPAAALVEALRLLRQSPPAALAGAHVRDIWLWAVEHWQPGRLAGLRALALDASATGP